MQKAPGISSPAGKTSILASQFSTELSQKRAGKGAKIAFSERGGAEKTRQIGANWVCFAKKHFAAADGLTIAGMVGGLLVDGELKIGETA